MRDANTEGLKWPAYITVTIHLLNQSTGMWEREWTSGNGWAPSKLSSEIESTTSCPYVLHSELGPYVMDDCLHIRVTSFTAHFLGQ